MIQRSLKGGDLCSNLVLNTCEIPMLLHCKVFVFGFYLKKLFPQTHFTLNHVIRPWEHNN